jgi:hypothetical protein
LSQDIRCRDSFISTHWHLHPVIAGYLDAHLRCRRGVSPSPSHPPVAPPPRDDCLTAP